MNFTVLLYDKTLQILQIFKHVYIVFAIHCDYFVSEFMCPDEMIILIVLYGYIKTERVSDVSFSKVN